MISDALILYDAVGANSFISLTRANEILDYHVKAPLWETQDDDSKKRLLIKAYNDIINLEGIELPVPPVSSCLEEAQADTALNYLINKDTYDERKIKQEKVGPLSTTYQDVDMLEPDLFTENSVNCLKDLGALQPNSAGALGSVRKSRY